jgi:hypothetical protein
MYKKKVEEMLYCFQKCMILSAKSEQMRQLVWRPLSALVLFELHAQPAIACHAEERTVVHRSGK